MLEGARLVSLDFDGTLVDSYSRMREVLEVLLLYLGVPAEMLDLVCDSALGEWLERERRGGMDYARLLELLTEAAARAGIAVAGERREFEELLLEARTLASSPMPCAEELLSALKGRGKVVACVSGGDGVPSMKRRRLEASGLAKFLDEVVVVGEDAPSLVDALASLAAKHGLSRAEVVHVDDRPSQANAAAESGFGAVLVKTGMYDPYARVREGVAVVDNLCSLYRALLGSER